MDANLSNTVGAFDAARQFSELLERVCEGELITITKHGSPVAKLVPVYPSTSIESRRVAIEGMRALATRNRLEGLKIKDLIAEGRK